MVSVEGLWKVFGDECMIRLGEEKEEERIKDEEGRKGRQR